MTALPPRRPWRRRKRTWAAGALWLLLPVLYVLGDGPGQYLVIRGWLSGPVYEAAMAPLWLVEPWLPGPVRGWLADRKLRWVMRALPVFPSPE